MTILAATITAAAATPPRGLRLTAADQSPRTVYHAWSGPDYIGTVWRQRTGRWFAMANYSGRQRRDFGTALQAARWLDAIV
jgi:hypothetical protein